MDPVINSLVQSPFVRSMSTVPSKATSFVHGVRDNVPPFSYQKVVVKPWNNISKTSQEQSHKFRIPQFGTLNRAYLRIKTINQQFATQQTTLSQYPNGMFQTTSIAANTDDAAYANLKAKVRIPWTHRIQTRTNPHRSAPLGGGGAPLLRDSAVNGQLGDGALNVQANLGLASNMLLIDPDDKVGNSSNAWNVVNILDEIRLTTNGKTIETLYGETIPAEVVKMPEQLREWYIKGMVGYANGEATGEPIAEPRYHQAWDPSACHRDVYGRLSLRDSYLEDDALRGSQVQLQRNQHANFIVPLTLSSLKSLSKNYQTRFVEDLELEVKTKELARGFNESTQSVTDKYHDVELVLIYHNWHDNIENTIRNSNYKRGVPASVYSTNWVRAATSFKVGSGLGPYAIPLTSRNLVTELVIVAKQLSIGSVGGVDTLKRRKSDYTSLVRDLVYKVDLTGSGKTIWSSTNLELQGADTSDYDLTDRKMQGGDAGYGGASFKNRALVYPIDKHNGFTTTSAAGGTEHRSDGRFPTQCGVEYSFGDAMSVMRFGFQTTDEFYTGGIALQTISNPTVNITFVQTGWDDLELEFNIYVKHANMVRIDSDTGAITRTLDV